MPDKELTSFDNRRLFFCQVLDIWPKIHIHKFDDKDCDQAKLQLKAQAESSEAGTKFKILASNAQTWGDCIMARL